MRSKIFLVGALMLLGAFARAEGPELVNVGSHTAYIPSGFDDNDKSQVVMEGIFSNTCYKVAGYTKKIENGTVSVVQQAYKYPGVCLEMLVPFYQVIDLGLMKMGSYKINDSVRNENLGTLEVTHSANVGPDDFLYAPISDAVLRKNSSGRYVVLSGTFSNSCLNFTDIKATKNGKNVLLVQPIIEKSGTDCKIGDFPFAKAVRITEKLDDGRYLLHVRSLNGQAVNKLVDVN